MSEEKSQITIKYNFEENSTLIEQVLNFLAENFWNNFNQIKKKSKKRVKSRSRKSESLMEEIR